MQIIILDVFPRNPSFADLSVCLALQVYIACHKQVLFSISSQLNLFEHFWALLSCILFSLFEHAFIMQQKCVFCLCVQASEPTEQSRTQRTACPKLCTFRLILNYSILFLKLILQNLKPVTSAADRIHPITHRSRHLWSTILNESTRGNSKSKRSDSIMSLKRRLLLSRKWRLWILQAQAQVRIVAQLMLISAVNARKNMRKKKMRSYKSEDSELMRCYALRELLKANLESTGKW